jgi:hypothetical protein
MDWPANFGPQWLAASAGGAGEFSWRVLLTLLAVLGLSAMTFALLVQRWTTQRRKVLLYDWCKGKGFWMGNPEADEAGEGAQSEGEAPAEPLIARWSRLGRSLALASRAAPKLVGQVKGVVRVREWVQSEDTVLMVVEVDSGAPARNHVASSIELSPHPGALSTQGQRERRFNVLVREMEIDGEWKATGLRPVHVTEGESLLDVYSLSSYPAMGNVERFVVYGTDTLSARELSKSHARGLLPGDVGLLLVGKKLMLDFSARHFDPIEFDRMVALAEQLVAQLPVPR